MEKILTIIIPSYNMEHYLDSCCKSLLVSETILNKIEVIIVNDGSKDNTSSIAHKYQNEYKNTFVVIDKQNGNYGSCINIGLKNAHGKYIKVLDADDTFKTENFEEYITLLEKNDVDLILSDFIGVDPDGNALFNISYPFEKEIIQSIEVFPDNIVDSFAMHAIAYKTENLKRIAYFQSEGISYTDQEWIFTPMITVKNFIYYNKPLYLYLIGRAGQTMSTEALKKNAGQGMKIAKKIIKDYLSNYEKITNESILYIQNKLYERCATQYKQYIIDYRKFVDFNDLKELDNIIKNDLIDIYTRLDNLKGINSFPYVTEWRKHFSNKTIRFKIFYFSLFCYNILKKIFHFIKGKKN